MYQEVWLNADANHLANEVTKETKEIEDKAVTTVRTLGLRRSLTKFGGEFEARDRTYKEYLQPSKALHFNRRGGRVHERRVLVVENFVVSPLHCQKAWACPWWNL